VRRGAAAEQITAVGALVVAAAIFGSTFVLVKEAVADVPALEFLAIRFAAGGLVLYALWRPPLRAIDPRAVLWCGGCLAAGYIFQTVGLQFTGATNAGFITGLFVVFTPVLGAMVLRRRPSVPAMLGVVLATAGLALLSLRFDAGTLRLGKGDLLVLCCAIAFAGHIVALGRFAPVTDHRALAFGQIMLSAVLFTALMPLTGVRAPTPRVWLALAVTALGATAFGFAVQTWVQTKLPPTRTAVVLTMEPAFAGLFGFLFLGERLSARQWLGAVLILIGMLTVEARPARATDEA
jgi:drug/metabolite transporter (DMT)-like permease